MKKYIILLTALTSLSASANDFTFVSGGLQYGIDDGLSDSVIGQSEGSVGGYSRISWNFYDHLFADYSISYNSYDGPSFQSSTLSLSSYSSTTKQDFGLGYYFELGSFSPYVKINRTSFKQSYKGTTDTFVPGGGDPQIFKESYTLKGYGVELGSMIHMSDAWALRVLASVTEPEGDNQNLHLYETYLISDTQFSKNWSFEAALGYRKLKDDYVNLGEFMPQVGVKYLF